MATNKFFKTLLFTLTIAVSLFEFSIENSSAYPVFAQQNYANPRAANGKLACANCHLNQKAIEIESPQAVLPNSIFEVEIKVPYDVNLQQIGANGQKADLNVGGILILPKGFKLAPKNLISDELKVKNNILVVFLVLVVESEDSQEERQHEVRVARRIVFPVVRQVFLVAQSHAVQEWNTGDPVPFRDFIAVLLVVLTTAVVPHEITEPHFAYLVFKEESNVLRKSDRRLRIFDVHDVDVVLAVLWVVVPNTREEALVLRIVVRHTSLFVVSQQVLTVDGEVAAIGRYIGFGLCLQLE